MSTGLPKILWDNRLADATPVASSTAEGYNVLNLRDWKPFTWWKPVSLPATVTVDCGLACAADYLCVYGHDLSSSRAAITLEASNNNFTSGVVPIASTNLLNFSNEMNAGIYFKNNVSVIERAGLGIKGLKTASLITENTANGIHFIDHWTGGSVLTPGGYWSGFVRVKENGRSKGVAIMNGNTVGLMASASFDLAAGTVTPILGTATIAPVGDGYFDIHITTPTTVNETEVNAHLRLRNNSGAETYAGDGVSGMYCDGIALNYGQPAKAYQSTTNNSAPVLIGFQSATYRYWRIRIPPLTGATSPNIAIASIGQALEIPRRLKQGFDPLGREPQGQSNRSEAGHPLGTVVDFELWSENLSWRNLNWNFVRNRFLPAWKAHLRGNPFVFAWDPVDHPDEIYLVQRDKGFKTPHQAGEYCDLSFSVKAVTP